MTDTYSFENLSPIEFEALCVDLLSADTGLSFERFSPGSDGGMDGRHSSASGNRILQAKHYKNSTWSDLKSAAKREHKNIQKLSPIEYHFHTSQPLNPSRKKELINRLDHSAVSSGNIWGKAEINDKLRKHPKVEKRHIKLWLSSAAILERVVHNDIAVFTEATEEEISRILKVYVENPSLASAAAILEKQHNLIISGPPGVGKTTLAQVLAAEYCDEGWELVAIADIADAFVAFKPEQRQVFVFDDFLGKIRLDPRSLAKSEGRISRFMSSLLKQKNKRFIMTTRSYVFQAAREISDVLDSDRIDLAELVIDLSVYTREIRARILYNHLYHSDLSQASIDAVISDDHVRRIIDHKNYMPRIVQWLTDQGALEGVKSEDYPQYFVQKLDNPDKIWEKAFRKHISEEARLLLFAMFFIERVAFPNPGVPLKRLKAFFSSLISKSELSTSTRSSSRIFEETLRELKSSFIIIDDQKANFVNPSVLDFLSKEVLDLEVLRTVAAGASHIDELRRIWKMTTDSFSENDQRVAKIASAIQRRLQDDTFEGFIPLRAASNLIGELLLVLPDESFIEFVRTKEFGSAVWINEPELVMTIEDLEEGRFSELPHAAALARILRRLLSKYVFETALSLEEAAELSQNLDESFVVFPDEFMDAVGASVEDAVDGLDLYKFDHGEDPETILGDWLEQIEKIELVTSSYTISNKRDDIGRALTAFEMRREEQMEDYRERTRFRGSGLGAEGASRDAQTFSSDDLDALFSSLKSRES